MRQLPIRLFSLRRIFTCSRSRIVSMNTEINLHVMKRYIVYLNVIWFGLFFACTNDDYQLYDTSLVNKIYFERDSFFFEYGPREDKEVDLEIPISLIGLANLQQDAEFKVSADIQNSTAKSGVHYGMDELQVFMKDSVTAVIKLDFKRYNLVKDIQYKLYLNLESNEGYIPTNKTRCVVFFGDISIEQPAWWRPDRLGTYSQEKLILFIKCFQSTKESLPVMYDGIVSKWGEFLDNEEHDRYQYLLTTYVYLGFLRQYLYTPMYEYYLQTGDERYRMPNPETTEYE